MVEHDITPHCNISRIITSHNIVCIAATRGGAALARYCDDPPINSMNAFLGVRRRARGELVLHRMLLEGASMRRVATHIDDGFSEGRATERLAGGLLRFWP